MDADADPADPADTDAERRDRDGYDGDGCDGEGRDGDGRDGDGRDRDGRDGAPTGDREMDGIDRRRRVRLGLVGGLVATVVMTAFRLPISESLPPTARFWARYVGGGDEADYPLQALALHLAYGSVAGGVYGALCGSGRLPSTAASERRGMLFGTVYGLGLSIVGTRVVLTRLLDVDLEPDEALVFHAGHLVYGFTLGAWFGSKVADAAGE